MEIAETETSQHTRGTPVLLVLEAGGNWGSIAARHTAATMQMLGNLSISNESRAARAPHPIAHTMKMHGSLCILNDQGR